MGPSTLAQSMDCTSDGCACKSNPVFCKCVRAVVGEQALKLKGDFTWEESAAPSLTNLEVSVDSGDLMVVVGSTGSGKSSLLGAALGLMQQVEGEPVDLRGKASALHSPVNCCLSVKSLLPFTPLSTVALSVIPLGQLSPFG